MLASNYGWTQDYILTSVYPEDYERLSRKIGLRRVKDWQMQLAIARNPFTDAAHQNDLPNVLRNQEAQLDPISQKPATLDKAGISALKRRLSKSGKVRAGG